MVMGSPQELVVGKTCLYFCKHLISFFPLGFLPNSFEVFLFWFGLVWFFGFCRFRATPMAYGGSQARG